MRIVAPVNSAREAAALISCGAGELYCGLHPEALAGRRGRQVWVNRRGPGTANIQTLEELKRLTQYARRHSVPVFLTLNLPFYPPDQYPEIISLSGEIISACGPDAFIIGDPGLMLAFRREIPGATFHVSSLAAVLNSASASFFRDLGADRIIFPRYMSLESLAAIIAKVGPGTQYEVFILNDGCVFEEGYCHTSHAFGGAFCHRPWQYRPAEVSAGRENLPDEPFKDHLRDYRRWLWFIKNCGGIRGCGGVPMGMCGLCAIPDLKSMGVASLKIVGREAPLEKKADSVRLVREALSIFEGDHDTERARKKVRLLRGAPDLCSSGYMCYFR